MAISITIKLDFDAFKNIQGSFRAQETATQATIGKLNSKIEQLRGGDWFGEGATKFFNEIDSQIMPSMKNLQKVLGEGDRSLEGDREGPARMRNQPHQLVLEHPRTSAELIQTHRIDRAIGRNHA